MRIRERPAVHVPNFNHVNLGKFILDVPLIDDVIQIGLPKAAIRETGRLIGVKAPGCALMALEDARPIQIDMVHVSQFPHEPHTRNKAFASPVNQLKIQQTRNFRGKELWVPITDDGLKLVSEEAFEAFIDRVGLFASTQQLKAATSRPRA